MIVAEFLIFLTTIFVAKYFWNNRRFYYLAHKIPRSSLKYSFQNLYEFFTVDSEKALRIVHEAFIGYEVCAKTWLGPWLCVGIMKPEDIEIILNSKDCLDKHFVSKFLNLMKSIAFGDIQYWHSHRKILNPYFGLKGLQSVIPIFNEKSKILMNNLKKMDGKGEFDVFYSMTALAFETIVKVMEYDIDIQNQKSESRDVFIKSSEKLSEIATIRTFQPWVYFDPIFKLTKMYKIQEEARSKTGIVFTNNIIQNAINLFEKNEDENGKSKTFIRALVNPKFNFSLEEIHDEVNTFMMAAQETSAIASSSTLLLLAMHKDIQQKVVDELHEIFGKTLDAPYLDYEKISELKYLEMVINEVMRLLPVVPYLIRTNAIDVQISEGYILPAKTCIIVPIFEVHRSKKIWGEDCNV